MGAPEFGGYIMSLLGFSYKNTTDEESDIAFGGILFKRILFKAVKICPEKAA